jgi:hypothetical protein
MLSLCCVAKLNISAVVVLGNREACWKWPMPPTSHCGLAQLKAMVEIEMNAVLE